MNSAHAFTYAMSGASTEAQMNRYSQFVNNSMARFQQMGGWLGEQASKTLDSFNNFINSRAWELNKRLFGDETGDYVGRFEVGYLGSLEGLQNAQGFMRDYIMAHPDVMQGYLDETLEGFGGEFNKLCTGLGEDNLFYRRGMSGVLNLETKDDKLTLRHTHYHESMGGGLSFRERVGVQDTWRAIDHHMAAKMFDVTSPSGRELKTEEE